MPRWLSVCLHQVACHVGYLYVYIRLHDTLVICMSTSGCMTRWLSGCLHQVACHVGYLDVYIRLHDTLVIWMSTSGCMTRWLSGCLHQVGSSFSSVNSLHRYFEKMSKVFTGTILSQDSFLCGWFYCFFRTAGNVHANIDVTQWLKA